MADFVDVTFTIRRSEYIRAIRRYYKTKLALWRDGVVSVLMLALGLYLLQSIGIPFFAWLLIILSVCLLALTIYSLLLLPQFIYRSQPKLKSEYRLRFREDAIRFQTDEIDSEVKWSFYHSWQRDQEFYLLYHGARDLSVIPRRALQSQDDERLLELLKRRISKQIQ
ncbi:YcxB family protein [cf. Phormidesmis sp. LEGE 11477]|uniref:YcxB family protein n=1 Tax=cf. Phormidesmis sp. LEGE 11477 TaxID=1828680 RepID=UPI001880D0F7|nr:YcxB family protein [cf. Phormidesmis sp. LEGE 11477]MBE9060631.1 YcxB family protein [cf. Phormidesmis sp. LEGE 11477]